MKKYLSIMPVFVLMAGVNAGSGYYSKGEYPIMQKTDRGYKNLNYSHAEQMKSNTIVDVALSDPKFSTLVTALKAAGLVETLQGAGPFTVFAPTNAAFEKIPAAELKALLADKEKLKSVLLYHVVPSKVLAQDVITIAEAKTAQGGKVAVDASSGAVFINDSKVVQADIITANGVIHVIDTVLLP